MASPRGTRNNSNSDGVVIVPPTYLRTPADKDHPGNVQDRRQFQSRTSPMSADYRNGRAQSQSRISNQVAGTREFRASPPDFRRVGYEDRRQYDPDRLLNVEDREYPTMADRLLALRASQRTGGAVVNSVPGTVPSPGDRQPTSQPSGPASRHVITTSHGAEPTSGTVKRSRTASCAIPIFTGVSCLVAIPMLVVGVVFLARADSTNDLSDSGVVLAVISSLLLIVAILVYILFRLGHCTSPSTQLTHIEVHRSQNNQTNKQTSAASEGIEQKIYRPLPAPGYHTPLPFGPVIPGYIPPQVLYSQYAKKSFNHRAILDGTDSPPAEPSPSLDGLPAEFRALSLKTQREASGGSPLAGPST